MKKKFVSSWKGSKQPRKQRKYRANAPLHIKQKFVSSHLSKDLKKKYGKRNIIVRKGDRVKITRGEFKNKIGKIDRTDLKKSKVYIEGVEIVKKDGTKVLRQIEPSNIIILELNLDDKKRLKILSRK
ncbi:50S ribosomal protein L24 [Candidatus Woesearchaeota archaeon]|nr:50S ribosomal protein L24 [Candidatus Woesearchaeota archaeon]